MAAEYLQRGSSVRPANRGRSTWPASRLRTGDLMPSNRTSAMAPRRHGGSTEYIAIWVAAHFRVVRPSAWIPGFGIGRHGKRCSGIWKAA